MDTRIVADEAFLAKVRAATSPAELCDASGKTVAVILTPDLFKDYLLAWADKEFDPERAELAWQDYLRNGGRSTSEVLEWLKTLDGTPDARP
jgi:hypothetical protein